MLRTGGGMPVTVFAPGGGATCADTAVWGDGVEGTRVFFEYDSVAPWSGDGSARPRREADRDADEVRALADEQRATRAVGISRGARAVLGALAEDPGRFDRVVLLVPPGGHAAGRYAPWLAALPTRAPSADILVVGRRGDPVHPARVASEWAERLSARLEVIPPGRALREALGGVFTEFLNQGG